MFNHTYEHPSLYEKLHMAAQIAINKKNAARKKKNVIIHIS